MVRADLMSVIVGGGVLASEVGVVAVAEASAAAPPPAAIQRTLAAEGFTPPMTRSYEATTVGQVIGEHLTILAASPTIHRDREIDADEGDGRSPRATPECLRRNGNTVTVILGYTLRVRSVTWTAARKGGLNAGRGR